MDEPIDDLLSQPWLGNRDLCPDKICAGPKVQVVPAQTKIILFYAESLRD